MTKAAGVTFAEHAERLRAPLEAMLASLTGPRPGCPPRLREAMQYSLLAPGKRLRPMLVLMAAEACQGPLEVALPAACAVEMVHAYSLIHDDLPAMDDDDLRRGRPTCHVVYGEGMAILAGDALLSLAFQTLAEGVSPPATAVACCAALAAAAGPCQLVGGQADDIEGAGQDIGLADSKSPEVIAERLKALESIHARKTGALMRTSLHLGGLCAKANHACLDVLDQFGERLGLAFQIVDDLLDVHGNEQQTGKRLRKDRAAGKLTFPALLGVEQSAQRARELIDAACGELSRLPGPVAALRSLARFVLERTR